MLHVIKILIIVIFFIEQLYATSWIEGGDGVSNQIDKANEMLHDSSSEMIKNYAAWKKDLKYTYDFAYGVQYYLLSQFDVGNIKSSGGILRLNGSYELFQTTQGDALWFEFRFENRNPLFGSLAPDDTFAQRTATLNPADGYIGAMKTDIPVLNLTQIFSSYWGYSVGRLMSAAYLDTNYFHTFDGSFLNSSFTASPSVGLAGAGALGVVTKGFVTPHIITSVQLYDANAKTGKFSFETIKQKEFITALEFAYGMNEYEMQVYQLQVSLWHQDPRKSIQMQEGYGASISSSWNLDNIVTSLYFAHNNGGGNITSRSNATAMVEYATQKYGTIGFGVGWAKPTQRVKKDESVAETSWRYDIVAGVEVMADTQWINHTLNTNNHNSFVASLRLKVNL